MIKFNIHHCCKGSISFTAEINCVEDTPHEIKVGLAVEWALQNGIDLRGADLRGAKNVSALVIAQTRILPEGSLIGWKKCMNDVIVKLRIPEEARRSHAFGRKCRAEYAEVLEIFGASKAISKYDHETTYHVGETIKCHEWGEDWQEECSGGIHFFITREEAENY